VDIKLIKPKKINVSDKYSSQIYQYIKKNHKNVKSLLDIKVYCNLSYEIYDDEYNVVGKEIIPFDNDITNMRHVVIGRKEKESFGDEGYITWYYGNMLSEILGTGREKYTVFANPWWSKDEVIDITEWFWRTYVDIGRCIYADHERWVSDDRDTRWTYINKNSRRCNWCREYQTRHTETKKTIKRTEVWK
jgi:hypothetical protein